MGQSEIRKTGRVWLMLLAVAAVTACQTVPTSIPEDVKVSVLVGGKSVANKRMIKALRNEFGQRIKTYQIGKHRKSDRQLIASLSKNKNMPVVAVGHRATRLAKLIKNKPVYFSRIYDPNFAKIMGNKFRGISILPDEQSVFWALQSLNPSASRIGIITGSGMDQAIARTKKSAAGYGYKIIHREVETDRGFLYEAKRMSDKVDVYWLFPDNRILSSTAIKDFMRKAVKGGKQVIAFSPALLKLGALMSVEADERAIAKLIHQMIISDRSGIKKDFIGVQHVRKMRIHISKLTADRLGIKIPDTLRRFQYE